MQAKLGESSVAVATTIHDFRSEAPFALERGHKLDGLTVRYSVCGDLSSDNPVVWILHALTGDYRVDRWWSGVVGADKVYDPEHYTIICANALGSPYGSTSPISLNAEGNPYLYDFPLLTYKDIVGAFELLRKFLDIPKIHTLVGLSSGGQQALEWAVSSSGLFERLVIVSANAKQSPWGIAQNESNRMAIALDATWRPGAENAHVTDGLEGLKVARSGALLSYRHPIIYEEKHADNDKWDHFKASSYQQYQGKKFADRFNAHSYWTLLKAMDAHDVGRGRQGGYKQALKRITAPCLLIASNTDLLFPLDDMKALQKHLPQAQLSVLFSSYGHDAFLVNMEQVANYISTFYRTY